ncbi:MAG: hypothetical protein ACJAZM_002801 [Cyclobacteriaceae bacterium]|jgi:hypothetical protein
MWKVSLKYAVTAGIVEAILFNVGRWMGIHPMIEISHLFFDVVILTIFISLAAYEFRKYHNNGILHFWQGVSIGFLIVFPATIIFMLLIVIQFTGNDVLLDEYKQLAMQLLGDRSDIYLAQFGPEQYASQQNAIQNISYYQLFSSSFGKKLLAGLFVTPAISIVLRKKPF